MKKLIGLLLAVTLLMGVSACSSEPSIVGEYTFALDVSAYVLADFTASMVAMNYDASVLQWDKPVYIPISVAYGEDGTYKVYFDEANLDAAAASLNEMVIPLMDEISFLALRDQIMALFPVEVATREDLEPFLGYSWDEFMTVSMGGKSLEEGMSEYSKALIHQLFPDGTIGESYYKAEKGKLYYAETADGFSEEAYECYVVEGDTITITEGVGVEAPVSDYPYVLKKVNKEA